nr:YIP1 family protein [uncultured Methanolobus sp.]
MLQVLTDPNGFFKNRINEEIQWKNPLIIMTLMVIVGSITTYITMVSTLQSVLDMDMFGSAGKIIMALLLIFGSIIGVAFSWLLYTAIFYIISIIFGGEGDFKRTMEFVTYGFIPNIVSSIIAAYYTSRVFSNIDFSSITDPQAVQDMIFADPSMKIAAILGIIFTLWSANIWIFGIKYARNLSLKNAVITVGIPIGLSLLYTVLTVFVLR